MNTFRIQKGKDLKIKGAAKKEIVAFPLPQRVAVQPPDFKGMKPRLAVKEGDSVRQGSLVLTDKSIERLRVLSPASGKIIAINRGDKRVLLEVVIETESSQQTENFSKVGLQEIQSLTKEKITENLLERGLWPVIWQRPFSKIANPAESPKAIFIHAMNTEPLALDVDKIFEGQEDDFQLGLEIIQKLTSGKVHLCTARNTQTKALTQALGVEIHQFSGPHPAGNIGTHIHYVDPINKGDLVWIIEAQDVLRIAKTFKEGVYCVERIVAITGEGVTNRVYAKTILGASLSSLTGKDSSEGMRYLTGSVLAGREVGKNGFVGFYDSQVTVIPEGGEREFLGWLNPGVNKYSLTKTFISSFLKERDFSLNTDENGGHRAMVLNHVYDELVPLDIYTYFLLRAIIAEDIEEAEKLGILECDEEDFALCTFVCPSKTDVGEIIRDGLNLIEREE